MRATDPKNPSNNIIMDILISLSNEVSSLKEEIKGNKRARNEEPSRENSSTHKRARSQYDFNNYTRRNDPITEQNESENSGNKNRGKEENDCKVKRALLGCGHDFPSKYNIRRIFI